MAKGRIGEKYKQKSLSFFKPYTPIKRRILRFTAFYFFMPIDYHFAYKTSKIAEFRPYTLSFFRSTLFKKEKEKSSSKNSIVDKFPPLNRLTFLISLFPLLLL